MRQEQDPYSPNLKGYKTPDGFFKTNAERLMNIPEREEPKTFRLQTLFALSGMAAALALLITLAWPSSDSVTVSQDEIFAYLEKEGIYDIEESLLVEAYEESIEPTDLDYGDYLTEIETETIVESLSTEE